MKKVFMFTILCVVLFAAAGNFEVQAQEAHSRFSGSFPAAVANQPSPLINGITLLEQRDYGISLFITGMLIGTVIPAVLTSSLILVALLPPVFSITTAAIITTASGIAGAIGLGMWIAGAVYWGEGNRILSRGIILSEREHGTPDVLLALDTEINGLGVAIRY